MHVAFCGILALLSATALASVTTLPNSTYLNPVIPGWHSDPSCVRVKETYFCAVSSFLAVPGLPVYASSDLINWKLVSHAWTRPDQIGLPNAARDVDYQQGGFYAPNLRYRNGQFHLTCAYVGPTTFNGVLGTTQTTRNPFDSDAWSDAVFWDDDGTTYLSSAGILLQEIDLATGNVSEPVSIWNGTGLPYPEGPHIYKKDGWYYLLIAEGGTELGHRAAVARSRNVKGPYESDPAGPFLTNNNTGEYFQTVGHADLFQDDRGKWWGMALATRSGPEWKRYPMGRESVLFPVTWKKSQWPVASQVRGEMNGWSLPRGNQALPGAGPFAGDDDVVDFESGSSIPQNFLYWRFPADGAFQVAPKGHPNALRVRPSRANLSGPINSTEKALTGKLGLSFIGRKQAHTFFSHTVDLLFTPNNSNQEAGVTVFLTQPNHISLGLAKTPGKKNRYELRFRTTTTTSTNTHTTPVPQTWNLAQNLRLEISTFNETHYVFSAHPADRAKDRLVLGYADTQIVSGDSGPFTGALIGVYATCNGAGEKDLVFCPPGGDAFFGRWRYTGIGQKIDFSRIVHSDADGHTRIAVP